MAAEIAQKTHLIDQHLAEKGLPFPSFDAAAPADTKLPPTWSKRGYQSCKQHKNVDESWPAAGKVVDALKKWPQAAEPNETGLSLANDTDKPFYAVLAQYPQRAKRFGQAMSFFTTGDGYALRHLTDGYPWDTIWHFQELPEVVANAKPEEGLNVEFMTHDFFNEQPVKHGDVYYLRWTLYNWLDTYYVRILRALIPALKKGARMLVMDFVMPPPGVLPNGLDRKLRAMDLTMLEIANAKERDPEEWKGLFGEADRRFIFKGIKQFPASRLAIIETAWEE
ncbi:hypothetical protein SLS60_004296 [Paraconiothyrium brasiliense]|uniref:O-methyltransferase C-terminal domain-containing protein n=1 Tax=Paraconiothyrium brasiliense TaxID=300254 RepID=A0ABR3RJZ1_9PLEO